MTPLSLTEDIVIKKLSQLKFGKSPGLDQLHPRILYETRDVIAYPLYLIFNKSLQTGIRGSPFRDSRTRDLMTLTQLKDDSGFVTPLT